MTTARLAHGARVELLLRRYRILGAEPLGVHGDRATAGEVEHLDQLDRAGRAIEAGRVWTNTYHQYPAHAALCG